GILRERYPPERPARQRTALGEPPQGIAPQERLRVCASDFTDQHSRRLLGLLPLQLIHDAVSHKPGAAAGERPRGEAQQAQAGERRVLAVAEWPRGPVPREPHLLERAEQRAPAAPEAPGRLLEGAATFLEEFHRAFCPLLGGLYSVT